MSHRSLFWPISLIIIAAATLLLILVGAPADFSAATISAADECPTESATYEICYKTATAAAKIATKTPDYSRIIDGCPTDGPAARPPYPPYEDCLKTRTALLLQTERAGATATPTAAPAQSQPTFTRTPTITATATLTATATPVASPTFAPTATPSATAMVVVAQPTAEEPVDESAITCLPGEIILVEGVADPDVALILTFGGRPVGGGFSRADGSYRLRLRIGDERPGVYPVAVEERATSAQVQELLCRVPAFTPTPTPPLLP